MHDVIDAFKALGLHGMASAWPEVLGTARMKSLDHEAVLHQLIKAETAQREVRSMAYQMRNSKTSWWTFSRSIREPPQRAKTCAPSTSSSSGVRQSRTTTGGVTAMLSPCAIVDSSPSIFFCSFIKPSIKASPPTTSKK